jgi:large subunit ribosomal protein L16
MLSPKKTKYRKYQKGTVGGIKPNTTELRFGKYGLKSLQAGILNSRIIEAVRRAMSRKFKRNGQIWIRVFPDIPVTQKPSEVRMGKGKGAPCFWVSRVQPGQILYEMDGISFQLAKQAALLVYHKMPIKTAFVCVD